MDGMMMMETEDVEGEEDPLLTQFQLKRRWETR